jgi:tetratricopeptide (TPR) repeat protein
MTLRTIRHWIALAACGAALIVCSCANALSGKPPHWSSGYVFGSRGAAYFSEGKLATALSFYAKGLKQAEIHDIPEQAGLYLFNMGRCFLELDKYDSARACFAAAYREFSLSSKETEARQAAGFAALAWSAAGAADSAFAWYKLGAITPKNTRDKTFWLMVHGRLVWARDHTKEALAYLDEACDLYKKDKAWYGAAEACLARARVYQYFGDYPEASLQITQALSLGDKSPLRANRWRILCAAATISACAKDMDRATWYYDRATKCMAEGKAVPARDSVMMCRNEMPW